MSKRQLKQEIQNLKIKKKGHLLFICQEGGTSKSLDKLRERLHEALDEAMEGQDFLHQAIISNFRIKLRYVNVEGIRALCLSGDKLTPDETKQMFENSLKQIKAAIAVAIADKYLDYLTDLLKAHGVEYKSYDAWSGYSPKACSRYSIISGQN